MADDYPKTTAGGYNHDIIVTEEFLSRHSSLQGVLKFAALEKYFAEYNGKTCAAKKTWNIVSTAALLLGVVAVLGVLSEISAPALGSHLPLAAIIAVEVSALLSLVLFLVARFGRFRLSYVNNCFARERLRHLRFQVFVDGPFTERLAAGDQQAAATLHNELSDLLEQFKDLSGSRQVFEKNISSSDRLIFTPKAYTDPGVAEAVYKALKVIRVNHQLSYSERRLDEEPEDRPLALKEHVHWSEAASKWCLAVAIIVPVMQLMTIVLAKDITHGYTGALHISLSTFAVAMACISAGVRSYQTGTGAAAEIDSYEIYVSHLEGIREQFFHSKKDSRGMVLALRDLELEAERELRRFLKIKRKASFLFS